MMRIALRLAAIRGFNADAFPLGTLSERLSVKCRHEAFGRVALPVLDLELLSITD
jgi:hypothetical protein